MHCLVPNIFPRTGFSSNDKNIFYLLAKKDAGISVFSLSFNSLYISIRRRKQYFLGRRPFFSSFCVLPVRDTQHSGARMRVYGKRREESKASREGRG